MSWLEYLPLLAATLAIELAVIEIARKVRPPAPRRSDILWVNLATHPLAYLLIGWNPSAFLLVEVLVTIAEGAGYRWLNPQLPLAKALVLSAIANGITAFIGWMMV
ncbi:MAG: hypothetical protein RL885_02900 [Planctomycetota bacterium]